jgi:hypothetical protein
MLFLFFLLVVFLFLYLGWSYYQSIQIPPVFPETLPTKEEESDIESDISFDKWI